MSWTNGQLLGGGGVTGGYVPEGAVSKSLKNSEKEKILSLSNNGDTMIFRDNYMNAEHLAFRLNSEKSNSK